MLPPLTLGRYAAEARPPRPSPYLNAAPPAPYAYAEVVADGQDIAASYTVAELDSLGASAGGRTQYALRVADDGAKPVLLIAQGIHGNEIDYAPALTHWIRRICDQDTPDANTFLDTFALCVILTVNPDGMAGNKRRNDNGIDLNRNWPQYWADFPSPESEKGSAALSEPETQNIADWYEAQGLAGRIVSAMDLHGWASRDEWGWICEQHFYEAQAEWLQRQGFLHYRHLSRARDWSAYTWTDADPRYPNEYRSNYKPYLYTYARHLSRKDAWAGLWEYPVGENKAVTCTVLLDVLDGLMLSAIDSQRPDVPAELIGPEAQILNDMPYFDQWETLNNRPSYYRKSNLVLNDRPAAEGVGLYGQRAVELLRPSARPWGYAAHAMGYAQTDSYRLSVAGERASGSPSNAVYQETNEAFEGSLYIGHYPETAQWNAACGAPGDVVYAAGGYGDIGYNFTVWRLALGRTLSGRGWAPIATLPAGVQRHAMTYAEGQVYVIGGRLSDGYTDRMLAVDPGSGDVTDVGPLPNGPRGYLAAATLGGTVYIFGGYNPTVGIVADVLAYDPAGGTFTQLADMPAPRRKMAVCVDEDSGRIYLWGGDDGSYNAVSTVWRFDPSSGFTDIPLDLLTVGGDGETTESTIPAPIRSAGIMFHIRSRNELLLAGGEDDSGNRFDDVYIVDLAENNFTYRRGFDDVYAYGWIRSNNVVTGSAGDRFTVTAALRGETPYPIDAVPYARVVVYVSGPGGLNDIRRKVRQWYTVPPTDEYGVFTVPVTLYDDEQEVRAYIRLYGLDFRILLGTFQITKTDTAYPELLPPGQTWRPESAPRVYYANREPLRFDPNRPAFPLHGYFSPMWGANMDNYVTALSFIPSGETGEPVTGARLLYDSRLPDDLSPYLRLGFDYYFQEPDYSFWIFEVDFSDGRTERQTAHADKLNFTRVSRSWRRDTVGWALRYRNGALRLAVHWASAAIELAIPVPAGPGGLIGWRVEPSGVLIPAARADQPAAEAAPVATVGDAMRAGGSLTSTPQNLVRLRGRQAATLGAGTADTGAIVESAAPFARIDGEPIAHRGSLTSGLDSLASRPAPPRRGARLIRK